MANVSIPLFLLALGVMHVLASTVTRASSLTAKLAVFVLGFLGLALGLIFMLTDFQIFAPVSAFVRNGLMLIAIGTVLAGLVLQVRKLNRTSGRGPA